MSNDFPFKIETLLEQCGGNKDVGGMILDEFITQVAADIKELESCLADNRLVQAGKVGHRLKGTAGVLGATDLYAHCVALEAAGKKENAEDVVKVFPELKTEVNRCLDAVPEARNRL